MKALIAVLVLLAQAARAEAADPEVAFRDATRLVAAGDFEGAQAAFEAVADLDPAGPWADDALAEAATAAERRGDLSDARRLWRRVLDEHPESRQARRARARVAALEEAIGADDRWLAVAEEHERILRESVSQSDPSPQIAALAALVAEHPEYPRATEARLWIGDAWMRMARPDRAIAAFREAADGTADDEERWRATKSLGDAHLLDGDFEAAERTYRSLYGKGDAMADRVIDDALRDVAKIRLRARVSLGAWAVLVAALLMFAASAWRATGGPRPALRALVRPPVEVLYFAPVAAVIAGVALTGNLLVWAAVRSILLGGLAVTWLGGASLEAARRARKLDLPVLTFHLATTAFAIAAICWLSIMHERLIDMIAETWARGHDR